MANLGEVPSPEFDAPMHLGEVEVFRDRVLFPAIEYLSHGRFIPDTALLGEQYATTVDTATPEGFVRHGVEAVCWVNLNADRDELGQQTISIKIISDAQRPEQTGPLIREARELVDPGNSLDIVFLEDSDNEPLSAWEKTTVAFERNGTNVVSVSRNRVLEDGEGVEHWDDQYMERHEDKCNLSIEERVALYEMKYQMESVLTQSDCRLVVATLGALGIPEEVITQLVRLADLEGVIEG